MNRVFRQPVSLGIVAFVPSPYPQKCQEFPKSAKKCQTCQSVPNKFWKVLKSAKVCQKTQKNAIKDTKVPKSREKWPKVPKCAKSARKGGISLYRCTFIEIQCLLYAGFFPYYSRCPIYDNKLQSDKHGVPKLRIYERYKQLKIYPPHLRVLMAKIVCSLYLLCVYKCDSLSVASVSCSTANSRTLEVLARRPEVQCDQKVLSSGHWMRPLLASHTFLLAWVTRRPTLWPRQMGQWGDHLCFSQCPNRQWLELYFCNRISAKPKMYVKSLFKKKVFIKL